ncbi:hypothetical protein [Mycobacterium sp. NPDC050853]|nr:hypothetical protein [Mycobacteroides sp. LB1]
MGKHNSPVATDDWPSEFVWDSEITGTSPAVIDSDLDFVPTPPPWFRA